MASTSISGADITDYIAYFKDGGTLPSGVIADGHVTSAKIADGNVTSGKVKANGLVAANFAYEKVTGTAGSAVTTAAHTLGKVPTLVVPVSKTSGSSVAVTGWTSTHLMGIYASAETTSFEIYVFA